MWDIPTLYYFHFLIDYKIKLVIYGGMTKHPGLSKAGLFVFPSNIIINTILILFTHKYLEIDDKLVTYLKGIR